MKHSLGIVLGLIVSGAAAAACGTKPPVPGTLRPDGQATHGTREEVEGECYDSEQWSYDLEGIFTCEGAHKLRETLNCSLLCGGPADCFFGDTREVPLYAKDCPRMPKQLYCSVTTKSKGCPVEGRRPAGLHGVGGDPYASVADYFAIAAHLEAAAVLAFERMGADLARHGAPAVLLARVRRAAREERQHVVVTSALARRFGGEPLPAHTDSVVERSLFDIALENVVEGVVRETYGAAVALFRAQRAEDRVIRRALTGIAADECRHAELSWALHEWIGKRLTKDEQAALEQARLEAIETLRRSLDAEPHDDLARLVGVPSASDAAYLHGRLFDEVWTAAA
jgi:hypothetical protein